MTSLKPRAVLREGLSRRKVLGGLAPALALALSPSSARAQRPAPPFPTQQMRLIVPYPPGGPTDVLARIVATELSDAMRQNVIVENRPGASGVLGVKQFLQLPPDGHSLLIGNNQTHVTNALLLKSSGYDPVSDFQPLAGLADLQHILVARQTLGISTVREFVSLGRRMRLNYGSTGIGSGSHLAMELFASRAGMELQHVAYKGAAQLALDVVTSQLDVALAIVPSVLAQIQGGQLQPLAVASHMRSPQLPDVPLLKEQGIEGAESDSWLALFTHAAVPQPVAARLSEIVMAGLAKRAVADAIVRQGTALNVREPGAFRAFHGAEIEKWRNVVRLANVKMEN